MCLWLSLWLWLWMWLWPVAVAEPVAMAADVDVACGCGLWLHLYQRLWPTQCLEHGGPYTPNPTWSMEAPAPSTPTLPGAWRAWP